MVENPVESKKKMKKKIDKVERGLKKMDEEWAKRRKEMLGELLEEKVGIEGKKQKMEEQ